MGASRAVDPGSRRKHMEIYSKAVMFSPTGRSWAAATTEGLLVYGLDESLTFDPFDLDEDITPESIKRTLKRQEFTKALLMSLHLNEEDLIAQCVEGVPLESIALVAGALKDTYLKRLLMLVAKRIDASPHLEFYLQWSLAVLNAHGAKLRNESTEFLATLRSLQKSIAHHVHDLAKVYVWCGGGGERDKGSWVLYVYVCVCVQVRRPVHAQLPAQLAHPEGKAAAGARRRRRRRGRTHGNRRGIELKKGCAWTTVTAKINRYFILLLVVCLSHRYIEWSSSFSCCVA